MRIFAITFVKVTSSSYLQDLEKLKGWIKQLSDGECNCKGCSKKICKDQIETVAAATMVGQFDFCLVFYSDSLSALEEFVTKCLKFTDVGVIDTQTFVGNRIAIKKGEEARPA